MSISRVSNRWLNRVYKSMAIMLVLLAVFISALRLFLPYAHNYRQEFQDYINDTYQSNIIIGSLSMGWQKDGPTLVTENVSLLHTDTTEIFIEKIDLHLDFWRSIKDRRLVTKDFTMDGAKVLVDKTEVAQGNVTPRDASLIEGISDLFLQQVGRFSLRDSQVIFQTEDKRRTVLIERLAWLNNDNRHQAQGDVIFDGLSSNNLKLLMDLEGASISEMQGQVYLQANNLNITPWLDKILAIEDDKTASQINFDAWLTIENGQAEQFQLEFGENEISWFHQGKPQNIRLNTGQLLVNSIDDFRHSQLQSSPLIFSINQQDQEPVLVQASKRNKVFSGYVSLIDLAGTAEILPLFVKDDKLTNLIEDLSPSGKISDVFIRKSNGALEISADFSELNSQFGSGIPGIEHVSGSLVVVNNQVQVEFAAENGALDFDKHFIRPIPYHHLSSRLNIQFDEQGWLLNVDKLELASEELRLSGEVAVSAPKGGEAEMSLMASVSGADAKLARFYYPHLLMGENLVDYLNGSILSGEIDQAQVLYNGPLARFPFNDHEGIFVVDAELSNSEFQFDPQWPAIKNFAANLNFTNNSMLITGRSGELSGLDVSGVTAAIESLSKEQVLVVNADIDPTQAQIVAGLMQQSPLADSVGKVLEQVAISDAITGEFSLTLPLNDTESVVAKGKVNFTDNAIALQAPEMNFTQVNGQLNFRNDIITVNGLSLYWRDLPLELTVKGADKSDYYETGIHIDANWQDSRWQEQVPDLLKKYGKGALAWQGNLALYNHRDGGFSYQLDMSSELYGVNLELPSPYRKVPYVNLPFKAEVTGQLNQSTINASLGEQLSFYGVLNHEEVQFSRAHLVLGDEKMLLPMDGFHITAKLEQADFSQWQPFIKDIIDTVETDQAMAQLPSANTQHLIARPERIRGTLGEMNIFGQSLSNVSFNLLDKQAWWLLQLNAKEARSQVKFYPDWLEQGIDINADFMHFASKPEEVAAATADEEKERVVSENTEGEPVTDSPLLNDDVIFANVPPMRVHCDSCRFGMLDLGTVDFEIERTQDSVIDLKRFTAKRGKTQLTFNAYWLYDENGSNTQIEGEFSAKDVEQEIERLGYASIIKDSGIKASFDANWQGGPHDFSVDGLNGRVTSRLDDGYLADVSDKGARIFSVLSLQSLVRKLTLDFRDIFSDGMFYSNIKGDFNVKDGILYTDNTKMKGAAGDLTIKGNTELGQGLLDYRMSYKPNLTSSLPVLAWIATLQPAVFLAGVAIDQVFTAKVVSEFTFELTGTVDEPNLVQVDKKSKDVSVGRSTPPQIVDNASPSEPIEKSKGSGTEPVKSKTDKQADDADG